MSYDIDGKPLFDNFRHAGPAWDPHREYPEPDDYPNGRPPDVPGLSAHSGINLRGDPLECHCPPRRCICGRFTGELSPHPTDMLEKIERSTPVPKENAQ